MNEQNSMNDEIRDEIRDEMRDEKNLNDGRHDQKEHVEKNRSVYLDFAAATPMDPEVVQAMLPYYTELFITRLLRTSMPEQSEMRWSEHAHHWHMALGPDREILS